MPNNLDSNVSQIVLKKFLPGFMSDLVLAKTVEPTPQVLSNAQRSYDALMTDTLVVPSMRRRGDFPVGQGNKYDVFTSDRYYPGDLPLIDGDIPNA
ncbi:packaged DNA stabilization gp4 family protein [Escherichia coli O113:H4]